jgi:predicted GTPase
VSASGREAGPGSQRETRRVVILGAAGRDFHNFNVVYRDNPRFEVVAFTAAQIPDIAGRRYPAALAGARYPDGIPIVQEAELEGVCRSLGVDHVVFAYSDVPHAYVMHLASRALAAGADFVLLGPQRTMLPARVPVIAVSAVRTGCGKSQTARWISRRLRARGLRVAVIRHPMPYGDLEAQAVQRFANRSDLVEGRCTIEEREEYEPHIAAGNVVYAGVDYARVVAAAQEEADVIVWDGGNNDFPFVRPGLHVVLVDPLRPGHETDHHPGETVLRMADVIVIAKTDAAAAADVQRVAETARRVNPHAPIVRAASPIRLEPPDAVRGKRVLVVEDGPSTTHGGMAYGAGYVAAVVGGAASIVHPQPFAVAEIARLYDDYPHLGPVLPAMGYSPAQLEALARSIDATPADVVVSGTPIDLAALVRLEKPVVRARYEFAEAQTPGLGAEIDRYLARAGLALAQG